MRHSCRLSCLLFDHTGLTFHAPPQYTYSPCWPAGIFYHLSCDHYALCRSMSPPFLADELYFSAFWIACIVRTSVKYWSSLFQRLVPVDSRYFPPWFSSNGRLTPLHPPRPACIPFSVVYHFQFASYNSFSTSLSVEAITSKNCFTHQKNYCNRLAEIS